MFFRPAFIWVKLIKGLCNSVLKVNFSEYFLNANELVNTVKNSLTAPRQA